MANEPKFATIGTATDKIDVRLSYRIVELFSEGLYASPNKAIEELVANSFDAGAKNVQVILSPSLHDQDASIVVIDDGEGMGIEGLKQHWLIGISNKRRLGTLPRGRQQIGQFGIGKLATYVLSERLTHISKRAGKYYSTSMDYSAIDRRVDKEVEPKVPITLALRELTEAQAKEAVLPWTGGSAFKTSNAILFGKGAPTTWTVAIMSSLKPKVHEIRLGVLEWVLRTALPLRDDFAIWFNGKRLIASKQAKGRIGKWVLGKDITVLSRPAPAETIAVEDKNLPVTDDRRFGLNIPELGRVTGYAEAYKDILAGKSDEIGRSYGFFVYIFGRLINVDDGHFGIDPNELRHGTFGRFRLVINIDSLDEELRANRETIRESTLYEIAKNVLRAIFNYVRPFIDRHDTDEDPGEKLARKLAGSPASLSRTPIVELARSVIEGKSTARYLAIPRLATDGEREGFLAALEDRAKDGEQFIAGLVIDNNASPEAGLAKFDTQDGVIRLNGWHPFVIAFHDEFTNKNTRQPLEILAMAEILAEAHLHSIGVRPEQIGEFLTARDQLLRTLANESGRQSPMAVARALQEARNNPDLLEQQLCAAFTSLGCDSRPIGGKGKADGIAVAVLSADSKGNPRQYSVSLEAKSKKTDVGKVAASTVDIAAVIRHRKAEECHHALVVGRSFPATETSALSQDIDDDRAKTAALGDPKTITLMTIDDLAELVRLRPLKQIGLVKLRELFQCRLPAETHAWIESVRTSSVKRPPYKKIVDTIADQQRRFKKNAVKFAGLRVALSNLTPSLHYDTDEEIANICKAMAQMSNGTMSVTLETVELDQSPANILTEIEAATRELEDSSNPSA
jgi:Histidine kinase-, DNA gyrase B-, and HSP90-like ATPase